MGSYQWYLTRDREELIKAAKEVAWREHKDLSVIMEELLRKWVEKTEKTHNPQTAISDYQDPAFRALPNLWTIDGPDDLRRLSTEDLREILDKARQLDYLATKRLQARGEG